MTQGKLKRCPTCGRREKRSTDANRRLWLLYHAMAAVPVHGERYSADQFHAYYRSRFLGCDDLKLPNGKVLTIPRSTRDLDVSEFSDYMTQVEADANARGVFLDEEIA